MVPSGTTLLISLSSLTKAAAIAVSSCGGEARCGGTHASDRQENSAPGSAASEQRAAGRAAACGASGMERAQLRRQGPSAPWLLCRQQPAARFGAQRPLCDAMTPRHRAEAVAYAESVRHDAQQRARLQSAQGQGSVGTLRAVCAPAGASSARPHRRAHHM